MPDPNNSRGKTILPTFTKIFEMIVQKIIKNNNNDGFMKHSQTEDNLFILQRSVQRQLSLGQNIIVCFIDCSRPFDLMGRHILFYKLIKYGLHGRVKNTMRSVYNRTCLCVKHGGTASRSIRQVVGVKQGGNASPIIFRKYMSDMKDYLDETQELFYHTMRFCYICCGLTT